MIKNFVLGENKMEKNALQAFLNEKSHKNCVHQMLAQIRIDVI